MSDSVFTAVPPGFELLEKGYGFIDILAPLYIRRDLEYPCIGLRVSGTHSNLMGNCHGGVLMTLLDVGLSASLRQRMSAAGGTPTMTLNTEFVNAAKQGEWIEYRAENVDVKRRFGFVSGVIYCGERRIAKGSGVFYLPESGFEMKSGLAEKLRSL
jgi:acyl-coenzyme A thioesterase PaaI-like protein